jgi:crossover junction endodeoxyribonuclease RusA
MELELPWPPTVNSYLAIVGNRKVKTERARQYCRKVVSYLSQQKVKSFRDNKIKIEIEAYPPDLRRRDMDNITKALFDSLKTAGLYDDDSQIDFFSVRRMGKLKGGKVCLRISEL